MFSRIRSSWWRGCALGLVVVLSVAGCSNLESASDLIPGNVEEEVTRAPLPATPTVTDTADTTTIDSATGPVFDQLREADFHGVIAIETGGDLTYEAFGYADRSLELANSKDTVFDIGSLTKQFTGAAILRLEMDGLLSVEDRVGDYLPELTDEQQAITLHELLTHTAGLPESLGDDYDTIDRSGFLDLVAQTPLTRAPGERHEYSNVGYSLLAAVIEVITAGSYEEYLSAELFEPAEMNDTGYVLPDWKSATVAFGYVGEFALGLPHEQPWASDGPYWHLRGNGGLLSTPADMMRWHHALLSNDVLDDEAKTKYYGRHTTEGPDSGTFYGYGWAIFPTPLNTSLVTHNGGNGVFFADFLRFLDDDLTIFMVSNAARIEDEDIAFDLAGRLLRSE